MYIRHKVDSAIVKMSREIPQGSALGPLLFLVYYNDAEAALSAVADTIFFADDTAVLTTGESLEDTAAKMNIALDRLRNYFQVNKMLLNVKKTECLFPFEEIRRVLNITYENRNLAVVSSFKYLGVHIDNMLTRKAHV
jgi:hypothetical protein